MQILVGWRSVTKDEQEIVVDKINNEINDISPFSTFYQVIHNCPNFTNGANAKDASIKYYGKSYDFFTVAPGAQYIVPKENILSRPLSFWQSLHDAMYKKELCAYTQELLWYLAFTHDMNTSFSNHDYEKAKCLTKFSMNHSPYSYFE